MSRKITSALPLLLGNICLLFLLLAGGFFSFVSAYGLPVNSPGLLAGCMGSSILFAVLWSVPYGGWGALALLGLDALAVWRQWGGLEPMMAALWKTVSSGAVDMTPFSYSRGLPLEIPAEIYTRNTLTAALLPLVLAFAVILGWLTVRERCWHLSAVLVTLPLVSALMSGVLPDLLPLLAAAAGWGTLLLTSLYSRRDPASLGRGLWMSLGGISALLLLLLALLPREGYYRPDWATNARDQVIETVNRGFSALWNENSGGGTAWNLDFGISSPSNGELDGEVDLTEAGPRRYSRQTVLRVTGGAGRTYLRGGAAGVYTGSGWKAVDESEYGEVAYAPDTFPALTVPDGTPAQTLTVRHVRGRGNNAYMPYRFLGFSGEQAYTVLDSGARRRGDEYEVAYIPGGPVAEAFTPLANGPKAWEQRYSEFVYSHYLDVPDEARAALRNLAQERMQALAEQGAFPDPPAELYQRFQQPAYLAMCTAKLLESVAVYDLDVPPMEPGEDFVTHFLEEGRGYCVHFATAGALLLRLEGIPARYVEGYAPWLAEGGTSNVRDSDAHAWVEIYLDGYGWYPVEMTPGRQGGVPEMVAPEVLQTEVPPEMPEDDAAEEEPEDPEVPEDSQPETPDTEAGTNMPEEPGPVDLSWLWKAAAVLLVLAAPYGGYRLARLVGKRRREHPDTNRSVIYAYRRYRLHRDSPEEPELEELGRKAKFSQHRLTEEERAAAWACADHAVEEWRRKKLPFRKKARK